ncbi:MAG: ABC transporter ATP-binding protein [Candidatus Caldarchaeum sp.]|nr:ABC transporter ATP-binding protein [Candidatus Caldarchaeum sp.]
MKKFGKTVAVNNVSFKIRKGEFFCIIGPSGCGKTTTLRLVAGLIRPDGGKLYINGVDYTNVPTYKRPIAMVFQTWALFPHMTVYENVEFGLKMRKISEAERKEAIKWALNLVKMEDYANRKPRELSGGQQQRVAIARALVVRPEILLLDEPLGNLDFKLQLRLQEELKQIHRVTGVTFLYVTHDQRQAMAMGTTIMVMNMGIIEQLGSPIELYSDPASVFVAKFVGESNILEGKIVAVENNRALVETPLATFQLPNKDAREGDRAWVFWRPEDTYLDRDAVGCDYRFQGEVQDVTTAGMATGYKVVVGKHLLKATVKGLPMNGIEPGSKILLGCKSSSLRLITRASSSGLADVERLILGE